MTLLYYMNELIVYIIEEKLLFLSCMSLVAHFFEVHTNWRVGLNKPT